MKKLLLILISLIFVKATLAQFDETEFINKTIRIYHNLAGSDLRNFSTNINSDYFLDITGDLNADEPFYPLELVWVAPDRMFFIKHGLPESLDEQQKTEVQNRQLELQPELKGILMDWQRFMGGPLLFDLPEEHMIATSGDTVYLEFISRAETSETNVKMIFGMNGLCLKITTIETDKKRKIITYPAFTLVDGKWLCRGWDVQIKENNEITGGFRVLLKSQKIEAFWLPWDLKLMVQTKEKLNKTFTRQYIFRNHQFNRPVQIVD